MAAGERDAPRTLDAVRSAPAGAERVRAAVAYVERAERAARDGRLIRDSEIRALVAVHGAARVRDLTGVALATVRSVARGVTREEPSPVELDDEEGPPSQ